MWSSPVEYIHLQCSTVFISFIWKRGMQFGADQSSEVQWTDCPVWYFPVQSRVVQCSAVWWSQAQTKTVQSSEVRCRPVQSSEVLSGSVQSSPVHSTNVRSSPFSEICTRPVQFQFIPFQLSTFQSSIAQVHISQQQWSLIHSSAVQSSAIRSSSTPTPHQHNQERLPTALSYAGLF